MSGRCQPHGDKPGDTSGCGTDEAIHLFVLFCDGFVALCVRGLTRDEGGKRSGQHRYVHMRCRGALPYVSWLELGESLMFVLLMCFFV